MKIHPASTVLMLRPVRFGFNADTAASNSFQNDTKEWDAAGIQERALKEFDDFVHLLREHTIEVQVYIDTPEPATPDSIFPNNWFSTHADGTLLVYPMASDNRADEVRQDILDDLQQKYGYHLDSTLLAFRAQKKYLEGTGSLILDQEHKIAFAALSPRTDASVLEAFSAKTGYKTVAFEAYGPSGENIYHTNVMMCLADRFVLIGLDTIAEQDRDRVVAELKALGKEIIPLNNEQVYTCFAGNMLQLQGKNGQKYLIMSQKARSSLFLNQLERITVHNNKIVAPDLETIETIGGGSARCMLAEIFVPI